MSRVLTLELRAVKAELRRLKEQLYDAECRLARIAVRLDVKDDPTAKVVGFIEPKPE